MYPLKLQSPLKEYIWGGQKLKTEFNKKTDLEKVAESFELSCHKDGHSIIENGKYKGLSLADYIKSEGKQVLGKNCERFDDFPILIKLIDAKDNLSVQVHPDDDYAKRVEGGFGKTEMWYIVDCEEDSSLVFGFKNDITKKEFKDRIENDTLLQVTNNVKVKKGDVFFIESGTLHSIGKGILIAEIQQNSNITYRVYDFGRVSADGTRRELHIDKALDVTNLKKASMTHTQDEKQDFDDYSIQKLCDCDLFNVTSVNLYKEASFISDESSFHSLVCLNGKCKINCDNGEEEINKGESIFIPANLGKYSLKGKADLLLTKI